HPVPATPFAPKENDALSVERPPVEPAPPSLSSREFQRSSKGEVAHDEPGLPERQSQYGEPTLTFAVKTRGSHQSVREISQKEISHRTLAPPADARYRCASHE